MVIPYNLRNMNRIYTTHVRTVHNGTEIISSRGPKTWELIPKDIKYSNSLILFKAKRYKTGAYRMHMQIVQNIHQRPRFYIGVVLFNSFFYLHLFVLLNRDANVPTLNKIYYLFLPGKFYP